MIGRDAVAGMPANPFVGPRPIEKDQPLFGRDLEIAQLYDLLCSERIVLLYSPSGAGKSSLIQAGLIPRLAQLFDVWKPVRVNLPRKRHRRQSLRPQLQSWLRGWGSHAPAAR